MLDTVVAVQIEAAHTGPHATLLPALSCLAEASHALAQKLRILRGEAIDRFATVAPGIGGACGIRTREGGIVEPDCALVSSAGRVNSGGKNQERNKQHLHTREEKRRRLDEITRSVTMYKLMGFGLYGSGNGGNRSTEATPVHSNSDLRQLYFSIHSWQLGFDGIRHFLLQWSAPHWAESPKQEEQSSESN